MKHEDYLYKLSAWAHVYRESEEPIYWTKKVWRTDEERVAAIEDGRQQFDISWAYIYKWLLALPLPAEALPDKFCTAVMELANCPSVGPSPCTWDAEFKSHFDAVYLRVRKSNCLARLLYANEELRTRECPTHKGHWGGWEDAGTCVCQSGMNITGWLPNVEMQK